MNERYLCKGKDKDDGRWYEGYYLLLHDTTYCCMPSDNAAETKRFEEENTHHYIVFEQMTDWGLPKRHLRAEILPETLCRCTGLKDKNGKLIWENDIVRFKHEKFDFDDGLEPWERTCLPNKKEYERNYTVEFCNTPTHYGLRLRNGSIWFMVHRMTIVMHDVEVIGNIFSNPELLEVEHE